MKPVNFGLSISKLLKCCYNNGVMDGVILLNKPSGMTSFDAVRQVRRIFHEKKAGHTGTLDPEASGLMIILLGRYTKMLPYCAANRKTYHATFSLGKASDTEDAWGNIIEEKEPSIHSESELDEAALKMTGRLMQVPPMYSAIKKDGKKLYEYARKGIEVEREARPIEVYSLAVKQTGENEFTMDACVSSGTYIRTLITDYAEQLGELALMTSLVRTGIDRLKLEEACTFADLGEGRGLISPLYVLDPSYERVPLMEEKKVRNGMKLSLGGYGDKIVFVDHEEPCAVYEKQEDGLYHCQRGLW